MTVYQEEMQSKAQSLGCAAEYDAENKRLAIAYKDIALAEVTEDGYLRCRSQNLADSDTRELFDRLIDHATLVREYVGLYESAPPMKPKTVSNYRNFCEFGDVVFAGAYNPAHGFLFCSWRQSESGERLAHGHYSPDYIAAKEEFAVRAGLICEDRIFTQEEAGELFKSAAYTRDNCESLTYDEEQRLLFLTEKMQDAYPSLKERPPSCDDSEVLQLNI